MCTHNWPIKLILIYQTKYVMVKKKKSHSITTSINLLINFEHFCFYFFPFPSRYRLPHVRNN